MLNFKREKKLRHAQASPAEIEEKTCSEVYRKEGIMNICEEMKEGKAAHVRGTAHQRLRRRLPELSPQWRRLVHEAGESLTVNIPDETVH